MVLALEREPRQRRRWGQVVARTWDDDAFRRRLLAEPAAVLREEGFDVPKDIEVRVLEGDAAGDAGDEDGFRLPAKPAADDLLEDDLSPPQDTPDGPVNLCHQTAVCRPCGHTHRSRGREVASLRLPARPANEDLVEDDLSLPQDVPDGPVSLCCTPIVCGRSGHTHRSRGREVASLRLPAKPGAGDLVEDDLSLPPDWPNGPVNICITSSRSGHTHRSRPAEVTCVRLPAQPVQENLLAEDLSLPQDAPGRQGSH